MISTKIINDYNSKLSFKNKTIYKLIESIFLFEKIKNVDISIICSNKNLVSDLKKKYFNVDQFTDVIAFNFESSSKFIEGEIYISIDDVLENSKTYETSFNNEFCRVLIHGVLHLIGYNDDNKKNIKIMRNLEDKYLLNCKKEIIDLKC